MPSNADLPWPDLYYPKLRRSSRFYSPLKWAWGLIGPRLLHQPRGLQNHKECTICRRELFVLASELHLRPELRTGKRPLFVSSTPVVLVSHDDLLKNADSCDACSFLYSAIFGDLSEAEKRECQDQVLQLSVTTTGIDLEVRVPRTVEHRGHKWSSPWQMRRFHYTQCMWYTPLSHRSILIAGW